MPSILNSLQPNELNVWISASSLRFECIIDPKFNMISYEDLKGNKLT